MTGARREHATPRQRQRTSRRRLAVAVAVVALAAVLAAGVVAARQTGPAVAVRGAGTGEPVALSGVEVRTGRTIDLNEFRGRPVVINIWASWCPGCNAEAAALGRFARAHPEAAVVGVNLQDSTAAALGFYDRHGWTFPSISDPDGRLAFGLGLQGTPTTIVLDAEHREVARIIGETDEAGFTDALTRATS